MSQQPGSPTAFEDLVDDYDAARPHYPPALYDVLPPLGDCLELGAGTGIASVGLRPRSLVVTDLGPRMLARGLAKHDWPGVVCRAEALPFAAGVVRLGLRCADVALDLDAGCRRRWRGCSDRAAGCCCGGTRSRPSTPRWWDAQQDRLEAGNPRYRRGYREVDYAARLAPHVHRRAAARDPPGRGRSRSTSTSGGCGRSPTCRSCPTSTRFVAACRADLLEAFPDGQVVEPFVTRLVLAGGRRVKVLRTPDVAASPTCPTSPGSQGFWRPRDGLRMAVIDEGSGPVVLMLHGEPSWSFLYRKMVQPFLDAGYRVVVPDLIGFGRSDKPAAIEDYTYARHVEWLRSVLFDRLDLTGITLIGQDWGGLLGLRLVAEHPERFANVVAANTGLPGRAAPAARRVVAVPRLRDAHRGPADRLPRRAGPSSTRCRRRSWPPTTHRSPIRRTRPVPVPFPT